MVNGFEKIYFVYGGEYESSESKRILPQHYVEFGPFYSYEDANECWQKNMMLNLTNFLYKLHIDVYDTGLGQSYEVA